MKGTERNEQQQITTLDWTAAQPLHTFKKIFKHIVKFSGVTYPRHTQNKNHKIFVPLN